MFAIDDIPLRFLIDHTLFHDYFRTDYPHSSVATQLFHYTLNRYTFVPKENIIIVPNVIFDKIQFEFPTYRGIAHSVIQSFRRIMELFPIEVTNPDLAMINVAYRLLSRDIRPIIISSVNEDKWLENIQNWGLEIELEGFTDVMSDNRIHERFPCELIDTKETDAKEKIFNILSNYDSEYQRILEIIES